MTTTPNLSTLTIIAAEEGDWYQFKNDRGIFHESHSVDTAALTSVLAVIGVPWVPLDMPLDHTGFEAPQQVPATAEGIHPLVIERSLAGDWVRVSQAGVTVAEGHSIGMPHVRDILSHLGIATQVEEMPGIDMS